VTEFNPHQGGAAKEMLRGNSAPEQRKIVFFPKAWPVAHHFTGTMVDHAVFRSAS